MITVQTRNLLFPDYFASHYKDYGKRSFSLCLSRGISLSKRKFIIISNWYIFFSTERRRESQSKSEKINCGITLKKTERERKRLLQVCHFISLLFFIAFIFSHLLIKMLGMLHQNFFTSFSVSLSLFQTTERKKWAKKTAHDAQLKYVCAFTRTRAI